MKKVRNYLSLIKFSHTIFAMPFAMIGFFLGIMKNRLPRGLRGFNRFIGRSGLDLQVGPKQNWPAKLLLVILCMIFARSAAMAFNRWLDRHFDAKNPRTAIREIPAGIISANSAVLFTIAAATLFVLTTYFINPLCFFLSPVALIVVLGYSYTKRFTPLCHLVLGIGLSLAPIGAYLAVTGTFALLPVLFSLAVIFWVSGFDIIYALQDEEFDKANDLYSMPSWVGKSKALTFSKFLHALCAACVLMAGKYGAFGWWYWTGVFIFMGMLLYQHSIVRPNDLSRVNLAFMTANGIASVVFSIFVITDLFVHA
jgi:4-hydroxybenzoate polyprenyltransferase